MARDEKPPRLRTVDDEPEAQVPVIRLSDRETRAVPTDTRTVRLGPVPVPIDEKPEVDVSRRLTLPDKEEVELRTHQPDIDVLIESENLNPELLEQAWGESSEHRHPIPWGWFALIGLAIAAAVIWSATRVRKADVTADLIRQETQSVIVDEQQEDIEATKQIEAIESTIRNFFKAGSVETLARLVRQPERVVPLMRDFYQNRNVGGQSLKSIRMLQPLTLDKRGDFWIASVSLADGAKSNLIIQTPEDGEPKIDWETFVCHQPKPWDEFVSSGPAGTSFDFRVYAERDNFNVHEFSDPEKWTCFRLTALDSEETLFGYATTGGNEERTLSHLIQSAGGPRASVILRLMIPEGLRARRSAVIEKVVNNRWLHIDPPSADP
jgi:hypothetical protein